MAIPGLTQSEKQRLYTERGGDDFAMMQAYRKKSMGARVIHCPQNTVEDRKLGKTLDQLQTSQSKVEAKLTRDQQTLKSAFRKIQANPRCIKVSERSSSDYPGFRYHKNGEVKVPLSKVISTASQFKIAAGRRIASAPQQRPTEQRLTSSVSAMQESRVKEHENYHPEAQRALSCNYADKIREYSKSPAKAILVRPYESENDVSCKVDLSAERFCRRMSKSNCQACKQRFLTSSDLNVKIKPRRVDPQSPTQQSQSPRGYYFMGRLESSMSTPTADKTLPAHRRKRLVGEKDTYERSSSHHGTYGGSTTYHTEDYRIKEDRINSSKGGRITSSKSGLPLQPSRPATVMDIRRAKNKIVS